jgi:type II secretory pathway component PulC
MSGIIYLMQEGDRLIRLEQTDYTREEDFQQLLQEFPELLAG